MKYLLILAAFSLTGCSYFTDHPQIQATATTVGKHLFYEAKQVTRQEFINLVRSYMGL